MTLNQLIKKLKKIQEQIKGDPHVTVDFDENGWYDLEVTEIVSDGDGEIMVNLKSSNEV